MLNRIAREESSYQQTNTIKLMREPPQNKGVTFVSSNHFGRETGNPPIMGPKFRKTPYFKKKSPSSIFGQLCYAITFRKETTGIKRKLGI